MGSLHNPLVPHYCRRSAGKKVDFDGEEHTIQEVTEDRWEMLKHQQAPSVTIRKLVILASTRPGTDDFNTLNCSFGDVQLALFSAGGSITKKFAPACEKAGCTVRV